jgi:hypothetical protein
MNEIKLLALSFGIIGTVLIFSGCANKPAMVVDNNVNMNINISTTTTTTSTAEIDTSDWKTYQNEEYGFEFKYPKDWIIIKNDLRKNIIFDEPVGLSLPNVWYLEFDTNIVKDNRHIPIHIFLEDCSIASTGCNYDLNNPIFQNKNLYILKDLSSSGRTWDIAQIIPINNSLDIKKIFGFEYVYDLEEGIGYHDYIGSEIRKNLDKLLFNVLKTTEFIK